MHLTVRPLRNRVAWITDRTAFFGAEGSALTRDQGLSGFPGVSDHEVEACLLPRESRL